MVDGTYEATITRLDVRQVEEAREKVAEDRTRHRIRVERRSILDAVAGDLLPAARSAAPVGRCLGRGGGALAWRSLSVEAVLDVVRLLVHHRAGDQPRLVVEQLAGVCRQPLCVSGTAR